MNEKLKALFDDYKEPIIKNIDNATKFTYQNCNMQIDNNIKIVADHLIRAVANSHDGVSLWTGVEGTGKTSNCTIFNFYIASELDKKFTIDNYVFSPDDLGKAIENADVGDIIIWDEAVLGLDSLDALTRVQRILRKKFTIIRKKRLFISLVIPHIFMLTTYFAVARSRILIHHICPDGIKRGRFYIYGKEKKQFLFFTGKKTWSYKNKKYDGLGSFIDPFNPEIVGVPPIDLDAYDKKKEEAIKKLDEEAEKQNASIRVETWKRRMYFTLLYYQYDPKKDRINLAECWQVNPTQISKCMRLLRDSFANVAKD